MTLTPEQEATIKKNLSDQYWRMNHLYWIQDANGNKVRFKMNAVQDDLREAADRGSDIPGVRHIAAPLASSSSWRLGMSSSESMGPRQVARRMAAAPDHREERAGWPR